MDTIDDPELSYYEEVTALAMSQGINYNNYESGIEIKEGLCLAMDIKQLNSLSKFSAIRDIIIDPTIPVFFQDDTIEVVRTNKYFYNIRLVTKGSNRLNSENRTEMNTDKYMNTTIESFLMSFQSTQITEFYKKRYDNFLKTFANSDNYLFLCSIKADPNFRTLNEVIEKRYSETILFIYKNFHERNKDALTKESKLKSMLDYYKYFNFDRILKINEKIDLSKDPSLNDHINSRINFLKKDKILI